MSARNRRSASGPRESKRISIGRMSEVDISHGALRLVREDRRDRRAKRQAKAAAKRVRLALQRFLDAVRSMGVDLGPKGLEVLTATALDVGLTVRRMCPSGSAAIQD